MYKSFQIVGRMALALGLVTGLTIFLSRNPRHDSPQSAQKPEPTKEENTDLQTVAENALAGREGAVVVLDPQTGRLRAVVNPELAFKTAFPPGSTLKPFTALAALRAGVLTENTRI